MCQDWRGEHCWTSTSRFAFPWRGPRLMGAPLDEPCPEAHAEANAPCTTCAGSGRVRPTKPDVETKTA